MLIFLPWPTLPSEACTVLEEDEPKMPMPPATRARTTTPTTATAGRGRYVQTLAPPVVRARAAARRPSGESWVPRAPVTRSR